MPVPPIYTHPGFDSLDRGVGMLDWIYCSCGIRLYRHTLLAKVKPTGYGCAEWTGQRDKHGYGRHCHMLANRAIWELCRGPLLPGVIVRHECDNPPCSLLDHLEDGTQADNHQDRIARGRPWGTRPTMRGEAGPGAKLTEGQVREIRHLWASGEVTKIGLSRAFPASRRTIQDIIAGRTWIDVS